MTFRLLTREEIETVPGMVSPIPASLWVMGAVDEKGVAAAIGCFFVLHADPLWVRPDKRKGGRLLRDLWYATKDEIRRGRLGPEVLWVGMTDENPGPPNDALVARACEAVGGYELKGRFFVIPVEA